MRFVRALCVLACLVPAVVTAQQSGNDRGAGAADLAQKLAMAEAIVSRQEALIGRRFDAAWHEHQVQHLASFTVAELVQIQMRDSGLAKSIQAAGPSLVGESGADLLYTPVEPCRIIDTRLVGGILTTQRNFYVAGSGFAGQGGVAGSCGIPLGPATAAVVNFIAVGPLGAGDFRAWPYPAAPPLASILNYQAVAGLNLANGVVVPICDPGVSLCNFDISMLADAAGAHVVADVLGYFRAVDTVVARTTTQATFPSMTLPATGAIGDFFEAVNFTPTRNSQCLVTASLDVETAGDAAAFLFFRAAVRNVTLATTTLHSGWGNDLGGPTNRGTVHQTVVFNLTGGQAYRFGFRVQTGGSWGTGTVAGYPTVTFVCK